MPRDVNGKRYSWESVRPMVEARYPQEGATYLHKELNVTYRTMVGKANKWGLRIAPGSEKAKQDSQHRLQSIYENYDKVKTDYFDHDTPNTAYIVGYTAADGSIKDQHRTSISYQIQWKCKEDDKEILEFIKRELCMEANIGRVKGKRMEDGHTRNNNPGSSLYLSHTPFVKAFMDKYHIYPRKTYTDPEWYCPFTPELTPHFIRGYFDGDGSFPRKIVKGHQYYSFVFYGTPRWLIGLKAHLMSILGLPDTKIVPQNTSNDIQQLTWAAKPDIQKLYHYLYPPGDNYFALPRKRNLIEHYLGLKPGTNLSTT